MNRKTLAMTVVPILPVIGIIMAIFFATHSGVILNASVTSTRLDKPGNGFLGMKGDYLSIVNLTDSPYPRGYDTINSVRSDCPLAIGQKIVVRAEQQQGFILYQGELPVTANMTLYKPTSSILGANSQYIPWNGCP